ncbi:hypothetical protein [Auritidibacter sp. NML100628]|uniref:hypothetical protein n=1 Tax=Auritidibacter sp. NML100628 TaxID=2170742 RepID=UPI000D731162|nr:hypothetical protein [Auritidibacter sp. NML100628]PXA78387.1 hypothetical protein DCC24_01525 [Auritidibacter sp. NML100628]
MPAHTVGNLTTVAVMWRLTLRVGPQVLTGLARRSRNVDRPHRQLPARTTSSPGFGFDRAN